MDVIQATAEYEAWLGKLCKLYPPDVAHKHKEMANGDDSFPFFRGTYYRWVELWAAGDAKLRAAPRVLAVGDLHLENFGTWRDTEGRLCWGVSDFDEADELPYTNDLVRLATSLRLADESGGLDIKFGDGCAAILEGYRDALAKGGTPFVLEENNSELRAMATASERDPIQYWEKLKKSLVVPETPPPAEARAALLRDLPEGASAEIRFRRKAGMGSLGKPRYVALVDRCGGYVCREAKRIAPAATVWLANGPTNVSRLAEAAGRATRSPDPFYRAENGWVVRRLAPRCSRIELDRLAKTDTRRVLTAMGAETANVHVGTPAAAAAILADLKVRPAGWLDAAAHTMANATNQDWRAWRRV